MTIIISALSVLAIILMFSGKFISVSYIESNERDVDSFSPIAMYTGLTAGILLVIIAFWTYRIHIVAGIIPFGVGAGLLLYCGYLLWCKSLTGAII